MRLITLQKLGTAHGSPRFWLETRRLEALGFLSGTPLAVEQRANRLTLRPTVQSNNRVSFRRAAGSQRPIIDINSSELLMPLAGYAELRVNASFKRIEVTPSVRAFYIAKRLKAKPPYKLMEFFAGGGMLSQAAGPDYDLVAGLEVEPDYADLWQAAHPNAALVQADIRLVHPSELPPFDVAVFGIPCTSHSTLGRAKKSLAQKPELGDTGDLYLSVINIVATKLPLACVFENVPSFGSSLAGLTLCSHLQKLGYHIEQTYLDPHREWGEPQDRKRWVMVATLQPGFQIVAPNVPFSGDLSAYLDPPDPERDAQDVARIAGTMEGLRAHNARHAAMGHGFGFTTISRESTKVPTLVSSYHKINTGPFVECPTGLRMLRKSEAERLMGGGVSCEHYATAIKAMFQGVQTRVFREVLNQLANFLFIQSALRSA